MKIKIDKPIKFEGELVLFKKPVSIFDYINLIVIIVLITTILYFPFYISDLKVYCPDRIKIIYENEKEIVGDCFYSGKVAQGKQITCQNYMLLDSSNISKIRFNITEIDANSTIKGFIYDK